MRKKFTYLLTALLVLLTAAPAAAAEYMCNKVSIEDGLSLSRVNTIARDRRGFLWIGTEFGLNRYDFETIKQYYYDVADESTIPDNRIVSLYVDNRGTLWVIGEVGVAYYDEATDSFHRIKTPDNRRINIRAICQEDDGLLMGSAGKFFYYDYKTGQTVALLIKDGSDKFYTQIHPWMPGHYAVATRWDGMWLFDRKHAQMRRMPNLPEKDIQASLTDSSGRLWVAPYGKGLFVYNRAGERTHTLTTANSDLPSDIVLDLAEINGHIWIATDGGGIAVYDPESKTFIHDAASLDLSGLGPVRSITSDNHGNVFAGTIRDGAAIIRRATMRTFNGWDSGHWRAITSIVADKDSTLWIGDDGNGVFRHRLGSHSFEQIPSTRGFKVTDMAPIDSRRMLLAVYGRNPYVLDKVTGQLTTADPALDNYFSHRENPTISVRLRPMAGGKIAIISDRIAIYDPATHLVTSVLKADELSNNGVLIPFYNRDGRLLCLDARTVTEYNPVTGMHTTLLQLPKGTNPLSAAFDGKQTVYIGTHTGILQANLADKTFKELQGMDRRAVQSMVFDGDGNLWVGTINSLFLKPAGSESLTAFSMNEGVGPNEYQPNAATFVDDRLYLGGTNGLLRVDCGATIQLLKDKESPELHVADIVIDGQRVNDRMSDGHLDVEPGPSAIHISFIDNGPNPSRGQMFRYIIRNADGEHTIETFSRALDINFPESGTDYEISVQAQHHDGTWTDPKQMLTLSIAQPWWRSWWANGIVLLIVAVVIFIIVRRRMARQKAAVAKKMQDLNQSALEREVAFMVNANYALRTPLTLIYAPVKLLIEDLRRNKTTSNLPERLEDIYVNTKRMRDTIDMVLELHNGTDDKPEVSDMTVHDISRSIRDVIDSYTDYANKEINISYQPDQEMFPAVYDRARLATVIRTLLRNASQRSVHGGTVTVTAYYNGNFIHVAVTDNGEPLDSQTLAGLFSKYFNDDHSVFGNSIEFAYAKTIIESQGGNIGADNNSGSRGLTVWFEYPRAERTAAEAYVRRRRAPQPAVPAADVTPVEETDMSTLTAVVVEEDSALCLFIAGQLAPYFGKVIHAFNGGEALAIIRQTLPDIVISSVMLPGRSGLELCQTVKTTPNLQHIPVILLTSVHEGESMERGYNAGADSYLAKPFDISILLTRCRNLLHTRSIIRNRYADSQAIATPAPSLTNADETFMLKTARTIDDNLHDPDFDVEKLCTQMALSRTAFYTRFKKVFGKPVAAYIAERRQERACQLLADPSLSINDIATMLGFSSQRYFSTFFKARYNMTPSAYRKSLDGEGDAPTPQS